MATTDVLICSRALILLGAGTISSFTEETDRALICKTAYPGLRDSILSKYAWRFLMTKRELTRDATAPLGEWAYSYVIPGGSISGAPHAVFYNAAGKLGRSQFEIFGRRLYTDEARVFVDQVESKPEDEWPAYFQQLMVYAMAAEVAFAITDQQNTADNWSVRAYGSPADGGLGGAMGDAMTLDAQGSANVGIEADAFIEARFSGAGVDRDFTWPGDA
jgi:hypothetical protein